MSRVTFVPTNALELIEAAATREAARAGLIEGRDPAEKPLDVLAQHAVTVAVGGGFDAGELYEEVRSTRAYRDLSPAEVAAELGIPAASVRSRIHYALRSLRERIDPGRVYACCA